MAVFSSDVVITVKSHSDAKRLQKILNPTQADKQSLGHRNRVKATVNRFKAAREAMKGN